MYCAVFLLETIFQDAGVNVSGFESFHLYEVPASPLVFVSWLPLLNLNFEENNVNAFDKAFTSFKLID